MPGSRGSTGRRDERPCPCWSTTQDVTAAIALQTTIQQLALVAGPALAGVLIATIGLSAVYGIDVATFAVALVAALLLPALVPSGGGTPMGCGR
jgi:predicted MFS family arabinose efflux permease